MKINSALVLFFASLEQALAFAPDPMPLREGRKLAATCLKDTERPEHISHVKLVDWFSFASETIQLDDWVSKQFNEFLDDETSTSGTVEWFSFAMSSAKGLKLPQDLASVKSTDTADWFATNLKLFEDKQKARITGNYKRMDPSEDIDWFAFASHEMTPKKTSSSYLSVDINEWMVRKFKACRINEVPEDFHEWVAHKFEPKKRNKAHGYEHVDWFAAATHPPPQRKTFQSPRTATQDTGMHADWFDYVCNEMAEQH